jgi:hypothetical protein
MTGLTMVRILYAAFVAASVALACILDRASRAANDDQP